MSLFQATRKLSLIYVRSPQQAGTYPRTHRKGSYLVEAVTVFPLFIGFMAFLMFYFPIMQVEITMQQALAYTSRWMAAVYAEQGEESLIGRKEAAYLLLQTRMKKEGVPTSYIQGGGLGVSLSGSSLEGEYVELEAHYQMRFPIDFFGIIEERRTQRAVSRAWIGRLTPDNEALAGGYVYVTPYGTAYHTTRTCAYLDLSIRYVSSTKLKTARNHTGGRYSPCSKCVKKKQADGYYITEYGDNYHTSLSCSGLKRSVYLIPRKSVGERKKCNKCAGGNP